MTVWLYLLTNSCNFAVIMKGHPRQSRWSYVLPRHVISISQRWHLHQCQSPEVTDLSIPNPKQDWCAELAGLDSAWICHDTDVMPKQPSYLAQSPVAATRRYSCCHWCIAFQGGSRWFCHSPSCTCGCQRWRIAYRNRSGIWNATLAPHNTVCSVLKRHVE